MTLEIFIKRVFLLLYRKETTDRAIGSGFMRTKVKVKMIFEERIGVKKCTKSLV